MHGHGSARVERVCAIILWGKCESGCSNHNGLGPEDHDDVQVTDRAEPLSGRIVSYRGISQAPMFLHAEEDVDTRSNRSGCCRLISEVRYRFPSNFILMVVQGKDNLGGVLEIFDWGVGWEGSIPNKENEVQ